MTENIGISKYLSLLCHSLLGLILIPHKEFWVVPVKGGQAERDKRQVFVGCGHISGDQEEMKTAATASFSLTIEHARLGLVRLVRLVRLVG